jgi:hypothetical protein
MHTSTGTLIENLAERRSVHSTPLELSIAIFYRCRIGSWASDAGPDSDVSRKIIAAFVKRGYLSVCLSQAWRTASVAPTIRARRR